MNRVLLLGSLAALATVTEARSPGLRPRLDVEECCPCPTEGSPDTATATVTVEKTVTEPASTIYVTHSQIIETQGPQQTVYVTPGGSQPEETPSEEEPEETPAEEVPSVVTKTIVPIETPLGPETVTVSIEPVGGQKFTITQGGNVVEEPTTPGVVTVTVVPSDDSEEPDNDTVVTKVVNLSPEPVEPQTIIVHQGPSSEPETSTLEPTQSQTTPQVVTITTAPDVETVPVVPGPTSYQTLTKTVTTGGNDIDIQIIIINLNTGEASCTLENSGLPCDSGDVTTVSPSATIPCPPFQNSTSISTVYNTVLVTGTPETPRNTTNSNSTTNYVARRPLVPLTVRW